MDCELLEDGQSCEAPVELEALFMPTPWGTSDADAEYELGLMHAYGEGIRQSHRRAARLFERAAEQGHADAQSMMGDYCRQGLGGVAEDFSAALDWYAKAAKQGNQYARRQLREWPDGD